ncbi:hypothetical protein [Rossellomorea vietnamensis]|uniref:hypothetical protein n=1 Tax=Rossellomorea vietnamensis TaxID=218284 RepID=UPI000760E3E2|nr:hypothetical protein [Rossellomorea vietnamensis]
MGITEDSPYLFHLFCIGDRVKLFILIFISELLDAQVDFIRPPDYRFIYEFKNPNIDAKAVLHQVWISPKKDELEVMQGPHEYTKLTKEDSARLFEILTGEGLGD